MGAAQSGTVEAAQTWETHPVTPDRFDDFADIVNPNRRVDACWCLSHRLRAQDIRELGGDGPNQREQAMRALCEREVPPGVVTYLDGIPVGWCNIVPRTDIPRLVASALIRPVDDVPVWSIICVVVRGGHRRQGVIRHLLDVGTPPRGRGCRMAYASDQWVGVPKVTNRSMWGRLL